MKCEIKFLTPVHIGTGIVLTKKNYNDQKNIRVKIGGSSLSVKDKDIKCEEALTYEKILKEIENNKDFSQEEEGMYKVKICEGISYENKINEQIKTLNKPYVPGSSIKGMIINCLKYKLKETSNLVDDEIKKIVKNLSRVITCNDIVISEDKSLKLFNIKRLYLEKEKLMEQPSNSSETIDRNKIINIDYLFKINEKYNSNDFTLDDLKTEEKLEKYIIDAIKSFNNDKLDELENKIENMSNKKDNKKLYPPLQKAIKFIIKENEKCKNNEFIFRIGADIGKSYIIDPLIDSSDNKNTKSSIKIYELDNNFFMPGFIKVKYDN